MGIGLRCHLLRLSSGLQLTETNSCPDLKWKLCSLIGRGCFLWPPLSVWGQGLTAWCSQRGRTYMLSLQRCGHVGRMTSQFRLHLNCSRWKYCCVLIILSLKANNATFLCFMYILNSQVCPLYFRCNVRLRMRKDGRFSLLTRCSWFILSEPKCLVSH